MVGGADVVLETDVFNGEMGHAAKHNAVNEQVNWLTEGWVGRATDAELVAAMTFQGRNLRALTNFATKADGALPAVDDLGRPVVKGGTVHLSSAAVSGGRGVVVPDGAAAAAYYYNTDLGAGVRGWGMRARCVWPAAAGGQTTSGSFGVLLWADPYTGTGTPQTEAAAHFGIGMAGLWAFSIIRGSAIITVATGTFTPPATDGVTIHETSYVIDPDTGDFYARLPDHTVAHVTAAQVAAASAGADLRTLGARYSCVEWFQNLATDVTPKVIGSEVYTDPTADAFRVRLGILRDAAATVGSSVRQPAIRSSRLNMRSFPIAAESVGTWASVVNALSPENVVRQNNTQANGDKFALWGDVSAGQWSFACHYFKGPAYGKWALEVSFNAGTTWIQVGAEQDAYNATNVVSSLTQIAGAATMIDGPFMFRVRVTGKNASSTGYLAVIAGDILMQRVS